MSTVFVRSIALTLFLCFFALTPNRPVVVSAPDEKLNFILALQWPIAVNPTLLPTDFESAGNMRYLTVHGLWIQSDDGTRIMNCTENPHNSHVCYNKVVEAWKKCNANQIWVNVKPKRKQSEASFIMYEWKTHGACAYKIIGDNTIKGFMDFVVKAYNHYHPKVLNIFDANRVDRSSKTVEAKSYPAKVMKDMKRTYQKDLRLSPLAFRCTFQDPGLQYLSEVLIRFDYDAKTGDFIDKPMGNYKNVCNQSKEFYFLTWPTGQLWAKKVPSVSSSGSLCGTRRWSTVCPPHWLRKISLFESKHFPVLYSIFVTDCGDDRIRIAKRNKINKQENMFWTELCQTHPKLNCDSFISNFRKVQKRFKTETISDYSSQPSQRLRTEPKLLKFRRGLIANKNTSVCWSANKTLWPKGGNLTSVWVCTCSRRCVSLGNLTTANSCSRHKDKNLKPFGNFRWVTFVCVSLQSDVDLLKYCRWPAVFSLKSTNGWQGSWSDNVFFVFDLSKFAWKPHWSQFWPFAKRTCARSSFWIHFEFIYDFDQNFPKPIFSLEFISNFPIETWRLLRFVRLQNNWKDLRPKSPSHLLLGRAKSVLRPTAGRKVWADKTGRPGIFNNLLLHWRNLVEICHGREEDTAYASLLDLLLNYGRQLVKIQLGYFLNGDQLLSISFPPTKQADLDYGCTQNFREDQQELFQQIPVRFPNLRELNLDLRWPFIPELVQLARSLPRLHVFFIDCFMDCLSFIDQQMRHQFKHVPFFFNSQQTKTEATSTVRVCLHVYRKGCIIYTLYIIHIWVLFVASSFTGVSSTLIDSPGRSFCAHLTLLSVLISIEQLKGFLMRRKFSRLFLCFINFPKTN